MLYARQCTITCIIVVLYSPVNEKIAWLQFLIVGTQAAPLRSASLYHATTTGRTPAARFRARNTTNVLSLSNDFAQRRKMFTPLAYTARSH